MDFARQPEQGHPAPFGAEARPVPETTPGRVLPFEHSAGRPAAPDAAEAEPAPEPEAWTDDLDELEELTFPRRRFPLSTRFLAVSILLALAFGGGILTQKHHDVGLVRPDAAALAALRGAAAGAAGGRSAIAGTLSAVNANDLTVRDQGGAEHKVAITDKTLIARRTDVKSLSTGGKVVIEGTTASDGTMQATAVVAP